MFFTKYKRNGRIRFTQEHCAETNNQDRLFSLHLVLKWGALQLAVVRGVDGVIFVIIEDILDLVFDRIAPLGCGGTAPTNYDVPF